MKRYDYIEGKSPNVPVSHKPTVDMYGWLLDMGGGGSYVLVGHVRNHPILEGERNIKTSMLLRIDFENNEAETLNTIYRLK